MEIAERTKRKYRKRGTLRDESAQPSAFPSGNESPAAERLENDAEEKKKVIEAAKAIPEIFTPDQVEWVFDAYAGIVSFVYSLLLKIEFEKINDELSFTDDQKKQLSVPLAKILSKHAPPEWAGNTAEIQLVVMMGIWTVSSFKRVKNVQKALDEKKKDAERTMPVQPIRREPLRDVHVPA